MNDLIEILVILFINYCVGWFVSFFVLVAGSTKAKLQIAIAHGYAILLLLIVTQFSTLEIVPLFHTLIVFDILAMVFFLTQYISEMQKKNSKNSETITNHLTTNN